MTSGRSTSASYVPSPRHGPEEAIENEIVTKKRNGHQKQKGAEHAPN
jgi:hypothetical protein